MTKSLLVSDLTILGSFYPEKDVNFLFGSGVINTINIDQTILLKGKVLFANQLILIGSLLCDDLQAEQSGSFPYLTLNSDNQVAYTDNSFSLNFSKNLVVNNLTVNNLYTSDSRRCLLGNTGDIILTVEKKITIQNIFESNNILVNASSLSGNIFFAPSLFTIGNDTQETNFYIFALENNNTGFYLVLNEKNQVGIFSQALKKDFYSSYVYENIRTNIINSNNEGYTLKINSYAKNTQIGTVKNNDINIIGKTIFITGSIGLIDLPYVTIKSKIILNLDLSINGGLIVSGEKLIIKNGLTIDSVIPKNVFLSLIMLIFLQLLHLKTLLLLQRKMLS